jgi:hypothetical protein
MGGLCGELVFLQTLHFGGWMWQGTLKMPQTAVH